MGDERSDSNQGLSEGISVSRLSIVTKDQAEVTVEGLYKDMERRIQASPPGLCPVDLAVSFLHICHSQSCGKCTPCRVGLNRLQDLINAVLSGKVQLDALQTIETMAESIYLSSDCAIGQEAARMVLMGVRGFREDYEEHVVHGRCLRTQNQPVPCVCLCPAHVDIPGYLALIHAGRYSEAVQLIRKDNPLPAVCGMICEHPCETRCRRTMVDNPINIRGLKRYAVEHEGEIRVPERMPLTGKKVAVVGGGPGGLSAAYYLSLMGHDVTIYEQRKKLGGMLRYGIPAYRLPREVLDKEIAGILSTGIHVKTEISIGNDFSIKDLHDHYDALYVAIGAHIDKKLGIESEETEGVISAVEMLRAIGDDNYPDFTGMNVVVVGGGNVAMDVARSAVRCNAKSVKLVYRRRKEDMTALPEEVEGAIADGVEIVELHAPLHIIKDKDNKLVSLSAQPQIIGEFKGGRPSPVNADVPEVFFPCDRLLVAIGQGIESRKFGEYGMPIKRGAIECLDTSGVKDTRGIFAGGDCVTGPATVIRAIAAGKVAAANIDEYLGFNHVIESTIEVPQVRFDDHTTCGRVNMAERPAAERVHDFKLMELPMTDEEAFQESGRCLRCDHFGYGVFKGGRIRQW